MSQFRALKGLQRDLEKRTGFAELLGYAFLVDPVVVLKDGAMMAVYRFYGEDVQATVDSLRGVIANRWSEGVTTLLPGAFMVEMDLIRHVARPHASAQTFSDVVPAVIEQERLYQFEQAGQLYESITYVAITWCPYKELSKRTKRFLYNSEDQAREKTPQERIQAFENQLAQFLPFVSFGGASQLTRLTGDALMGYLYGCLTGDHRPIACPDSRTFLDVALSRSAFIPGHEPQLGDQTIRVLAMDHYPQQVHAMMLHQLNQLPLNFRYHTRFARLTRQAAQKQLRAIQRNWSSKAIGMKGVMVQAFGGTAQLNEAAQQNKYAIQDCLTENDAGSLCYGYYSGQFIFMGNDQAALEEAVQTLRDMVQSLCFIVRDERVNATEAYLGSLSGHGGYNCRVNLLDSMAWSRMLPLSTIYAGEASCPNPYYPKNSPPLLTAVTDATNLYRLNLQVKDVGHTLILGPTGAGKSTLLQLLCMQHARYPGYRIICLDNSQTNKYALLAMGGQYYDPTDDNSDHLAPFLNLETSYGRITAQKWLTDTFMLNGVEMTAARRAEVGQSLQRLAALPPAYRRFSRLDFQESALRQAYQYLMGTLFGEIMDGTADTFAASSVIGMDILKVLDLPKELATPIIQCLLDQIMVSANRQAPTLLMIEEGWLLLDNPIYRPMIKEWLKTLRKKVVSVVLVSQSLSDVATSSIRDVLIESCPTQIYLPNRNARDALIQPHYHAMGRNEAEVGLIADGTPKQDYYVVQPHGRRLINLQLGPVAKAFIGIEGREEQAVFQRYYQAGTSDWVVPYLEHLGLTAAANFIATDYLPQHAGGPA